MRVSHGERASPVMRSAGRSGFWCFLKTVDRNGESEDERVLPECLVVSVSDQNSTVGRSRFDHVERVAGGNCETVGRKDVNQRPHAVRRRSRQTDTGCRRSRWRSCQKSTGPAAIRHLDRSARLARCRVSLHPCLGPVPPLEVPDPGHHGAVLTHGKHLSRAIVGEDAARGDNIPVPFACQMAGQRSMK